MLTRLSPPAEQLVSSTSRLLQDRKFDLASAVIEAIRIGDAGDRDPGPQATAILGALLDYAPHIGHLDEVEPGLQRLARIHAAIDIRPEHYSKVGDQLKPAMRDVLGGDASDRLISAWIDAYWLVARTLLAFTREAMVYEGLRAKAA